MSDPDAPAATATTLPEADLGKQHVPPARHGADHRRFWSPRRLPTGIVSLVGLVAVIAVLYDTVSVRADNPAQHWRRKIADELATRHLDDGWVIGAAIVVGVLGLWLIWFALTPGLRAVLPMRTASPDMRAGLDRRAAALVLRDSALQVAGVASARVKVGRRRARARVATHFRDRDEVRGEVLLVLEEELEGLGLARPLELVLLVREVQGR